MHFKVATQSESGQRNVKLHKAAVEAMVEVNEEVAELETRAMLHVLHTEIPIKKRNVTL